MCGIAATLIFPQERTERDWIGIRDLFTWNLIFNEERGPRATGVAIFQSDGQVKVLKEPVRACEFVRNNRYQRLLAEVNSQTTLLLGHTRLPTKGDPAFNGNNHPLQAGPIFGVHNGAITNDDTLFELLGLPRQAQVDSEVIFRLLEDIPPIHSDRDYLIAVRKPLQRLQGRFTFLACDTRRPTKLLALKHGNPLSVHFHQPWNSLLFSSSYSFLRKAFGQSPAPEILEQDRLMLYDALALPSLGSRSLDTFPYSRKLVYEPRIYITD